MERDGQGPKKIEGKGEWYTQRLVSSNKAPSSSSPSTIAQ